MGNKCLGRVKSNTADREECDNTKTVYCTANGDNFQTVNDSKRSAKSDNELEQIERNNAVYLRNNDQAIMCETALKSGNNEAMVFLVKEGYVITENNLKKAIRYHQNKILRFLLETGPEYHKSCSENLITFAILEQNYSAVTMLIAAGYDLNEGQFHDTPLITAIRTIDTEAVKCLIDAGCDINKHNGSLGSLLGVDALSIALETGNKEIMHLLRDCEIKPRYLDKTTVLTRLAQTVALYPTLNNKGKLQMAMECFRSKDIGSLVDRNGDSPLSMFIRSFGDVSKYAMEYTVFYDDCIRILTSHPSMVKAQPLALALAIEKGTINACELILSAMNCTNHCFPDGESPLHCAVRVESLEKCELLIKNNADIECKWRDMTPLELAISLRSKPKILEFLGLHMSQTLLQDCLLKSTFLCDNVPQNISRLGVKNWTPEPNLFTRSENLNIQTSRCKTSPKRKIKDTDSKLLLALIATSHQCNTNTETKRIINETKNLLNRLSQSIANDEKTSHFAFNVVIAGSVAEGTKTYFPNEIDAICQFIHAPLDISNNICVSKSSPWKDLCHTHKCGVMLSPLLLAQSFYQVCEVKLETLFSHYRNNASPKGNLYPHTHSFELRDKISCLHLLWKGPRFGEIVIHVDLVPAFLDKQFQLPNYFSDSDSRHTGSSCTYRSSNRVANSTFHRIAKISRRTHGYTASHFPISYACAEIDIINSLPVAIKRGLIIAKAVRIAAILSHAKLAYIREGETINCEEYITSYMLKNCLLNLLAKTEERSGNEYDWAEQIYGELATELQENGKLTSHFDLSENIFECQHSEAEFDPNGLFTMASLKPKCIQRLIILEICNVILEWFARNKDELKQLSYGKHCAYSRENHSFAKY